MELVPLLFAISGIMMLLITTGLHEVKEGYIGVYYRGGALLETISYSGYHWMIPFITSNEQVQTALHTDEVTNVNVHCFRINSVAQVAA